MSLIEELREEKIVLLEEVSKVEEAPRTSGKSLAAIQEHKEEVAEFKEMIARLQDFVQKMDRLSETASKSDRSWFFRSLMKILVK